MSYAVNDCLERTNFETMPVKTDSSSKPSVGADDAPGRSRPCVGPQIRRLRHERALTLAQVAQRTGLNVGYLSQVENDKASPSLETLAALASALDVPITWFLIDTVPPPRVVRAAERRTWRGPGGVAINEVDGGVARDLCIVSATSKPGERTGLHAHSGDEHHVVLAGRLRVYQGEHTVDLGPGDYLLWDGSIPHDSECLGPEPAEVLIITPRTRGTEGSRPDSE
jgi:transcriptional regulator with XRE-family HTH domain